jgi:voltage-gated sodium channel
VVALARRVVASPRFDAAILGVILLNAVVLGLETYDGAERDLGGVLDVLDTVCLTIFVVELALRLTACWPSPGSFFRSGWNVFDFVVVTASFVPGLRENVTLLRLLRLARVTRAVRLLPDLRVLVAAVVRSLPGVGSLAVMTLLLVYVFAMVGWVIFDEHDPENFGNVGQAMVTMFVLLTLENLPTYLEKGQELSDLTVVFFVGYVLLASFLVFNLFIGIVVSSMEEARNIEARLDREAERAAADASDSLLDDRVVDVEDRIDELRRALDELQTEIKARVG